MRHVKAGINPCIALTWCFVLLADAWAGDVQCAVSIANTGPSLTAVNVFFAKAQAYAAFATVVSCKEGDATVETNTDLATGVTRVCIVSLPLTPEEIAGNNVTLWAGSRAGTLASPTATARTTAVTEMKLVDFTVAVTSPASTTAPAAVDNVVPITVTITNTGPINITTGSGVGITVTPPNSTTFAAPCADLAVPAAPGDNTVTCTTSYTVVDTDLTAGVVKSLAFVATMDNIQEDTLKASITTPVTLSIPLTKLTTSFTAADCAPVSTGEFCQRAMLGPSSAADDF